MRYWLDTEFIEDGKTIDLISIGILADDGREFYAESLAANVSKASPWVQENVLPHLWSKQADKCDANAWIRDGGHGGLLSRADIARRVRGFCDPEQYGKPEFWGYYADYDWVVLCQLFGTMMDLPEEWPMYCRDLRQWADALGVTGPLDEYVPITGEHHALADAKWNRAAWEFLAKKAAH